MVLYYQPIKSARETSSLTARQPTGNGKVPKLERWVDDIGLSPIGRWAFLLLFILSSKAIDIERINRPRNSDKAEGDELFKILYQQQPE